MKIKFKVTDPLTGKKHRLTVKGDTEKICMKLMSANLIVRGVSQPRPEDIYAKIIKK